MKFLIVEPSIILYQMIGTNYEVPHCGAFYTPHYHPSWAQIFASGSCFQMPLVWNPPLCKRPYFTTIQHNCQYYCFIYFNFQYSVYSIYTITKTHSSQCNCICNVHFNFFPIFSFNSYLDTGQLRVCSIPSSRSQFFGLHTKFCLLVLFMSLPTFSTSLQVFLSSYLLGDSTIKHLFSMVPSGFLNVCPIRFYLRLLISIQIGNWSVSFSRSSLDHPRPSFLLFHTILNSSLTLIPNCIKECLMYHPIVCRRYIAVPVFESLQLNKQQGEINPRPFYPRHL